MRTQISIVLFALGTVGGYAAGFSWLHCRMDHRRSDFERHVATLCVDAARRAGTPPSSVAGGAPLRPVTAVGDSAPVP